MPDQAGVDDVIEVAHARAGSHPHVAFFAACAMACLHNAPLTEGPYLAPNLPSLDSRPDIGRRYTYYDTDGDLVFTHCAFDGGRTPTDEEARTRCWVCAAWGGKTICGRHKEEFAYKATDLLSLRGLCGCTTRTGASWRTD